MKKIEKDPTELGKKIEKASVELGKKIDEKLTNSTLIFRNIYMISFIFMFSIMEDGRIVLEND